MSRKRVFSIIMTAVLSISVSLGILCGTSNVVRALDISYIMYVLTKTGLPQELTMGDPIPDNFVIAIGHAAPDYGNKFSYDATTDSLVMDNVFVTHDTQDENGNEEDANYNGVFDQNMIQIGNVKGIYGKGTCSVDAYWINIDNVQSSTLTISLEPGATLELFNVQKNYTAVDANVFTLGEGVEMTTVNAEEGTFKFERKLIDIATLKDKATISPATAEYTGAAITPEVTITGLTKDVDFTVAYTNNIEPGTATVTITGIGAYTGSFTLEYTINKKEYKQEEVKDEKTGASYEVTTNADGTTVATYKSSTNKKAKKISVPANITLPDGSTAKVTRIAPKAFKGSKAKQITIPKTVTQIDAKAFSGSSAKKIIIKTDKKAKVKIGKGAFKNVKTDNLTVQIKGCKGDAKKNLSNQVKRQAPSGTTVK